MSEAQLVLMRFCDLVDRGHYLELEPFLDDHVIVSTWLGVIYGKATAMTFFEDFRRFMHFRKNFNTWRQVNHCLDPSLRVMRAHDTSESANGGDATGGDDAQRTRRGGGHHRVQGGDADVEQYFDESGFDSQGFATFEREGTIACSVAHPYWLIRLRHVVVLQNGKVKLYQLLKMRD